MRRIAIIIAMLGAGTAHARTLYECAGPAGHAYQQAPCAADMRPVRTMETIPEPAPTPAEVAERARKLAQDRAESAFLSHQAGTDRPLTTSRSARSVRGRAIAGKVGDECSAARASRERLLRSAGLGRTMELLSRLDESVADACAH